MPATAPVTKPASTRSRLSPACSQMRAALVAVLEQVDEAVPEQRRAGQEEIVDQPARGEQDPQKNQNAEAQESDAAIAEPAPGAATGDGVGARLAAIGRASSSDGVMRVLIAANSRRASGRSRRRA